MLIIPVHPVLEGLLIYHPIHHNSKFLLFSVLGFSPKKSNGQDVDFDTFNDAAKSIFNDGDELPEVSPQTLLATLRAVVQGEDGRSSEAFCEQNGVSRYRGC